MRRKGKRAGIILLIVTLVISMAGNVYLLYRFSRNRIWNIHFPDVNLRETYDSIHNVKKAQEISTGKDVKVGILDWGFAFADYGGLYAGGRDFTTYSYHEDNFNHTAEHGFWMAQTLKEIAPDVSVYALGTYCPDSEDAWVDAMIEAIDWAMEKEIDILTLSHEQLSDQNRPRFDEAVNKAIESGIVTTFIHYDNPDNILPWGIWSETGEEYYQRAADINIFPYDYNTLFLNDYTDAVIQADFDKTYKSQLFTSVSSMSVVTAGGVALLMEIDHTLTPSQYKEILVRTSRPLEYEGEFAEHVMDLEAAVRYLQEKTIE
ncbi:MAG: hypothetical protein NC302_00110 [Bacteroidales bacterium]|nr:hypothetical protein [Bacteroidales bacterium]MCM1414310.1 peptidase [bacterium]MCM1422190.1 peptidase [bacterium]